jgi:hypothetical protein
MTVDITASYLLTEKFVNKVSAFLWNTKFKALHEYVQHFEYENIKDRLYMFRPRQAIIRRRSQYDKLSLYGSTALYWPLAAFSVS